MLNAAAAQKCPPQGVFSKGRPSFSKKMPFFLENEGLRFPKLPTLAENGSKDS